MSEKVYVFVARTPFRYGQEAIAPPQRAAEIASCANASVREEKYSVWKLLEYGLKATFGRNIADLVFTRGENGKWGADGVEFSLSHSRGLVAAALSRIPVGVDIERFDGERFSRPFAENLFTEGERARLGKEGDPARLRAAIWTKKEAIFKCAGGSVFRPGRIGSDALPTETLSVRAGEEEFFLTVAADAPFGLSFLSPDGSALLHSAL